MRAQLPGHALILSAFGVEMLAHLIVASLFVSLSTASSLLSTDLYEVNLRHRRSRAPLKRAYGRARLARRAGPSSAVRPQSDVVTSSSGYNICPLVSQGWALAYAYIGSGNADACIYDNPDPSEALTQCSWAADGTFQSTTGTVDCPTNPETTQTLGDADSCYTECPAAPESYTLDPTTSVVRLGGPSFSGAQAAAVNYLNCAYAPSTGSAQSQSCLYNPFDGTYLDTAQDENTISSDSAFCSDNGLTSGAIAANANSCVDYYPVSSSY